MPKNTICNFLMIFRMVDFPLKNFDLSDYVLNHNLPEQYFKG